MANANAGPDGAAPPLAPSREGSPFASGAGRRVADVVYIVTPVLACAIAWEVIARSSGLPKVLFPPLEDIFRALGKMVVEGTLLRDLQATFARLAVSVVIGAAVGTVLGALMGSVRAWERAFVGPINFLLAVPGTALFPLAMMWFGLSEKTILSILVYEVALTVTANTWTGVKSIDLSLIRAGRAFGASGPSMFWRVLFPAALPSIITGYRLAFSRAWRILIVAEMLVSAAAGLGYRLYWARELFQTDVVYAGLLVVGTAGLLLERVVLRTLEKVTVERWGTVRVLE
ncbi:MAG TPA: ABC transporter permease [Casimicrobiaceae bacterium]|nr:ABC transporter permease [Casimicrobiaceae bacterium]